MNEQTNSVAPSRAPGHQPEAHAEIIEAVLAHLTRLGWRRETGDERRRAGVPTRDRRVEVMN